MKLNHTTGDCLACFPVAEEISLSSSSSPTTPSTLSICQPSPLSSSASCLVTPSTTSCLVTRRLLIWMILVLVSSTHQIRHLDLCVSVCLFPIRLCLTQKKLQRSWQSQNLMRVSSWHTESHLLIWHPRSLARNSSLK